MKNRMIKVWGIVLTLAILAGLLVASVPVSAANLAWTPNALPSATNNFLLPVGEGETTPVVNWVYAVSDDGSTILAYDADNDNFYKSVDGGVTFVSKDVGTNLGTGIKMMAIASDNTTAVASDGTDLYGSVNGGTSWVKMDLPSGFTSVSSTITCIDAATGPSFLIGGEDGVFARFGSASQLGGNWSVFSDWYIDDLEGDDVIGIAFSPTYASDKQIFVVTNDGTNTYVGISHDGLPVGRIYAMQQIDASATKAVLAFPSDFAVAPGSNFLLGLDNTGLWRVAVNQFAVTPLEVAVGNNIYNANGVTSLAFTGSWAAGTAYFVNNAAPAPALLRATGVGASSVTAVNSTVSGTPVGVSATEGKVTVISGGTGGAFNVSLDNGASFVQTNLIQAAFVINKITFADPNTFFVIADGDSIYKTTDAGVSWQRIQYQPGLNAFTNAFVSPAYATDNTVYFSTGGPLGWKSTDGGKTLIAFPVADEINDLVVVDANTFYYATDGGVYKSTAPFTALSGISGAYSLYYVDAANIYAGTDDGKVFKSTDGATFAEVGKASAFTSGNVVVAAAADGTVYAASDAAGAGVKKFGPTGWTAFGTLDATAEVAELAINSDGTVYAIDTAANIVYRNADGAAFENMNFDAAKLPAAATIFGNTIYVNGASYMANFTDTLSAPPVFTSPAEGATLLDVSVATLSWGAVTGATEYTWRISTTADMVSGEMTPAVATTKTTSVFLPNQNLTLVNGQTYYVTVQVTAPYKSKVSPVTSFMTKLNSLPTTLNLTAPAAGANVTTKTPTFSWSAVANAVSYEFKLSDKPDFSTTVDATTGITSTVYTTGVTLEEGKTYYWQVRAVNGDISSDWAQSTFAVTAAAAPGGDVPIITVNPPDVTVEPPEVIITVEPAPSASSETPAWVWVIIAIGAILIIAVVVLIARTRRV